MTFKTSAQRIVTYMHLPPTQMSHKLSVVTGSKYTDNNNNNNNEYIYIAQNK